MRAEVERFLAIDVSNNARRRGMSNPNWAKLDLRIKTTQHCTADMSTQALLSVILVLSCHMLSRMLRCLCDRAPDSFSDVPRAGFELRWEAASRGRRLSCLVVAWSARAAATFEPRRRACLYGAATSVPERCPARPRCVMLWPERHTIAHVVSRV
jgi:hypothetical protein